MEPGIAISVKLSISQRFIILREGASQITDHNHTTVWRQFLPYCQQPWPDTNTGNLGLV